MHASTAIFPSCPYQLDGQRIAGTSLAIALHVAVAMVLLMPVQQALAPLPDDPPLTMTVLPHFIPLTPLPPKPHAPDSHTVAPTPVAPIAPITPPQDIVVDPTPEGLLPYVPPVGIGDPPPIGSSFVDLQADRSPAPVYPSQAIAHNQEGMVMLRVLVDEQGRPAEVEIEQSSGFRLLDECALRIVRSRWHFVPAQRGGTTIAAWARVPIMFRIEH